MIFSSRTRPRPPAVPQNQPDDGSVKRSEEHFSNTYILGMKLAVLSADLRERYGIGKDIKGVVVTDVEKNGPAAEKSIAAGEVIQEVGQERVVSPQQVANKIAAQKKSGRKSALLLLGRTLDNLRFVALRLK